MKGESVEPRRETLYRLLPALYRVLDAARVPDDQKGPLRELLSVMGEQVNLLEDDLARWYDNWFIETCEDWVVPYIGDLIGYESAARELNTEDDPESPLNRAVVFPRREISETIALRRRKGTLALLEELSRRIVGWPARAVEYRRMTAGTASMNHLRVRRSGTVDVRDVDSLARLDATFDDRFFDHLRDRSAHHSPARRDVAFDRLPRTVDVRRIDSRRTQGRHNLPAVGLFVCRRKIDSAAFVPAFNREDQPDGGDGQFTFSPLGLDRLLHILPVPESAETTIAEAPNLPIPLTRRRLQPARRGRRGRKIDHLYYGIGKSLLMLRRNGGEWRRISRREIIAADLSQWVFPQLAGGQSKVNVAVDPELGRMLFQSRFEGPDEVMTIHHYGRAAWIGGGEYDRHFDGPACGGDAPVVVRVGRLEEVKTLREALQTWCDLDPKPPHFIIEIVDNNEYIADLHLEGVDAEVPGGATLEIRAANRQCPVLRIADEYASRSERFHICGKSGSRLILDGFVLATGTVRLSGDFAQVIVRDCTFQPGYTALMVDCLGAEITIDRSILGHLHVAPQPRPTGKSHAAPSAFHDEPPLLVIRDSILDPNRSQSADATIKPARYPDAIGDDRLFAYLRLRLLRSTALGKIHVHTIDLVENSICTETVAAENRQAGCVRFSYLPEYSRTPPPFHCQPSLAIARLGDPDHVPAVDADVVVTKESERLRLVPRFLSTAYGHPDYARLADDCPTEILEGADDEGEMGVYHNEFFGQRAIHLRQRLQEFIPAGSDAAILFET